jgi:ribokinase
MNNQSHTIWVVGSLNADLVQRVHRIPQPGETLPGGDLRTYPGGKGANQAYAAARLGGNVRMIGNVGNDRLGSMLIESLMSVGVNGSGIKRIDTTTGAASIFVMDNGENAIVISPGANGCLSPKNIQERLADIQEGDFLLCQLESPTETILEALRLAKAAGATTILDPAPATNFTAELLEHVDILTPNEIEACTIAGLSEIDVHDTASVKQLVADLRAQGCQSVLLKLGESGCYFSYGTDTTVVDGHSVEVVDTTGAGDAFNGALAARLASGHTMEQALEFANAAASLTVTQPGAQPSIPLPEAVDAIINASITRS